MKSIHVSRNIFLGKIIISLLIFLLLSYLVDWHAVLDCLQQLNLFWFIVALLVFWFAQLISSLRFFYIVRALGGDILFSKSIIVHFIGLWFNQILPGSLGGDILKFSILIRNLGASMSLRACILDRLAGLIFMNLAIFITLPLYARILPKQWMVVGLTIMSSIFLMALVGLSWSSTYLRKYFEESAWILKITQLLADICSFRRPIYFFHQFWTSAIVHFNGIFSYALMGIALNIDIDILNFVLIVPLVFLIALLPISFAGWGTREVGAIWLFGFIDVPYEEALSMSVAFGFFLILSALPGLAFTVFYRR